MHPRDQQSARRVHGAEFKAKVLAECREPGASLAAVALANGLNANLVRKWMHGRGLQRCGLSSDGGVAVQARGREERTPALQFVPVALATTGPSAEPSLRTSPSVSTEAAQIQVGLCRGDASLAVRWPASQAGQCSAWLRELVAQVLK